jgi:hypothetical protein
MQTNTTRHDVTCKTLYRWHIQIPHIFLIKIDILFVLLDLPITRYDITKILQKERLAEMGIRTGPDLTEAATVKLHPWN